MFALHAKLIKLVGESIVLSVQCITRFLRWGFSRM